MPATDPGDRVLIVGGTGRVGRMLQRVWASDRRFLFQSRRAGEQDLFWDPVTGSEPFRAWAEAGGCVALVVLARGALQQDGGPSDAEIAEACLQAAREANVGRVLYASSSAVYGAGRSLPFHETDTPSPIGDYGASKEAAEKVCERHRGPGLDVCALRIGNVVGADMLLLNSERATKENPLRLDRFPDGTGPRRSYIGPSAFARVIETLAFHPDTLPDLLNVAAPQPLPMDALLEAAAVPWRFTPAPPTAQQWITLDCASLADIVRFHPEDGDPAALIEDWRQWAVAP